MSDETLLKNAIRVLVRPNGLEEVRKNIKDAEYYFGLIDDENVFLNNLIWMGPPGPWQPYTEVATKEGKVYEKIVPKVESRSLRDVAAGICLEYSGDTSEDNTPEQLLTALYQESDWFGRHLSFGTHLDPVILSPLWVRSMGKNEEGGGESGWQDKLYIEDGNGRALVYALRILYGDEEFRPIPILWCRSWKHLLCWAGEPEIEDQNQDCPPTELKKYFKRCTVDEYLCRFKTLSES